MAGLDPVVEDVAKRADAQKAALMMLANNALTHDPPTTWKCYTAEGAFSANKGNLAWGGGGALGAGVNAIRMYMDDNGVLNVGHRGWMLVPSTAQMASGSTRNTNNLRMIDTAQNANAKNPGWITWPSAGYFPAALNPSGGLWSVAYENANKADFTNATVTVKRGTTVLPVSTTFKTNNNAGSKENGTKSIVVQVQGVTTPVDAAETTYTMTVSGVTGLPAGVSGTKTFTITMFNPTLKSTTTAQITGQPVVGQTLTVGNVNFAETPTATTYQWLRNGTAISGATGTSYTLTAADLNATITATASATKAGWVGGKSTTAGVGPVKAATTQALTATAPVSITGTTVVGQTLTAKAAAWSATPDKVTYQWLRNGTAISGATGTTYTLTAADLNTTITVKATATKSGYTAGTSTSAAAGPIAQKAATLTVTKAPSITGSTAIGEKLTVVPPTWSATPDKVTYQWYNGTTISPQSAIPGATGTTYYVSKADVGQNLTVVATATKAGYTTATAKATKGPVVWVTAMTASTAVKITGTARVGETLTATPAVWNVAPDTRTYQWYRGNTAIVGATGSTYKLTAADVFATIKVRETATKTGVTGSSTSAAVGPVAAAPALTAKTKPTVTGTKTVGSVLTAKPGTWNVTPDKVTYQWLRGGTPIAGATGSTYTLTTSDYLRTISVRVTATKSGYTAATATSAPVGLIGRGTTAINSVVIAPTGTAGLLKSTVTVTTPCTAATKTYQWYRNGLPILGANGANYQTKAADLNRKITVKVTVSHIACTAAAKTSAAVVATGAGAYSGY